jgi:hypothetical protein
LVHPSFFLNNTDAHSNADSVGITHKYGLSFRQTALCQDPMANSLTDSS